MHFNNKWRGKTTFPGRHVTHAHYPESEPAILCSVYVIQKYRYEKGAGVGIGIFCPQLFLILYKLCDKS